VAGVLAISGRAASGPRLTRRLPPMRWGDGTACPRRPLDHPEGKASPQPARWPARWTGAGTLRLARPPWLGGAGIHGRSDGPIASATGHAMTSVSTMSEVREGRRQWHCQTRERSGATTVNVSTMTEGSAKATAGASAAKRGGGHHDGQRLDHGRRFGEGCASAGATNNRHHRSTKPQLSRRSWAARDRSSQAGANAAAMTSPFDTSAAANAATGLLPSSSTKHGRRCGGPRDLRTQRRVTGDQVPTMPTSCRPVLRAIGSSQWLFSRAAQGGQRANADRRCMFHEAARQGRRATIASRFGNR